MKTSEKYLAIIRQLVTVSIFMLIWYIASYLVNSNVLPDPISVIQTFFQELGNGLIDHIMISSYRVLVSIVISAFIGTLAGIFIGMSPKAYSISAPEIYLT